MQPRFYTTLPKGIFTNLAASLQQFYALTNVLSKTRNVRFAYKSDEADNIEWHFKYKGKELVLEYNIYNGLSLYPVDAKDSDTAKKLMEQVSAARL